MSEVKRYADRDIMQLDRDGNHYCNHVLAMTAEGLHSKSDIAAELAFRDAAVDRVTAERDAALGREAALKETLERWLDLDKSRDADKEAYAQNAIDLRKRVDALQQRLTAADERADVLEGLLREVVALDPRGKFLGWQLDGKIDAALKPADGLDRRDMAAKMHLMKREGGGDE